MESKPTDVGQMRKLTVGEETQKSWSQHRNTVILIKLLEVECKAYRNKNQSVSFPAQ